VARWQALSYTERLRTAYQSFADTLHQGLWLTEALLETARILERFREKQRQK